MERPLYLKSLPLGVGHHSTNLFFATILGALLTDRFPLQARAGKRVFARPSTSLGAPLFRAPRFFAFRLSLALCLAHTLNLPAPQCALYAWALQTEKITLDQAMDLAESRSFSSRVASLSAVAAEERYGQARGQALPRIDFDAQKIWFSDDVNKLTGVSPFLPAEVTTAGVTVAQPIIGLGPLLLQIRAASMQAEVSRNEETTAKRDARLQGADAFLRAQKAAQLFSIAQKSLDLVEAQMKESAALVRAGRLNRSDAMRFELAHADAVQQLSQAQFTQQMARVSLAELLGQPETIFEISEPQESLVERVMLGKQEAGLARSGNLPATEMGFDLPAALERAQQNRTESTNAEVSLQIAKYYKLASNLDYLPSLNAFARYERDFEAQDTLFPPPPSPGGKAFAQADVQDKFSYGLQLKWNIWDWGTRWARSGEFQANIEKAKIAKEAAESSVRIEVTSAYLALKTARDGLETARTSVRLAEEVFRLTQVRFQSGQATSNDVIVAERDQTRARGGLVSIRADLDLAWLKFQRAIGEKPGTPSSLRQE